MQQLIINRKQFPPQAEHRAKDHGPATTRRHKWVTGCNGSTHVYMEVCNETTNPVRNSFLHSSFALPSPLLLSLFSHLTVIVRSEHTTHPARDCVSSAPTLSRGQTNSLQPSCLCFKVISDLSIWDSTPQAAPAEGSWAKQWPFHGEYDSYSSSFVRQHVANHVWYHVVFARITVIA